MTKYNYCVDIDIENFFDNVNHKVLINQIYNLGIQDKKLLAILSKMLKVNVEGEGIKKIGLVQGGVLSPLLSNIVLNELDWWINSQCKMLGQTSAEDRIYFVRYADDFRILCKNFSDAFKVFNVVKAWLKEKLNLNISSEKSKITNLRTQGTEFLGFKIKSTLENGAYSVESHVSDDNKLKIQNALCKIILRINGKSKNIRKILQELNRQIATSHSYYQSASHVQQDFLSISRHCQNLLDDRLKDIAQKVPFMPDAPNVMTYKVDDIVLIPIEYVSYKRLESLPLGASIYSNVGSPKSNVTKFSRRPMKKYRPRKKSEPQKTLTSESSSSLAKIKNSVLDFLCRLGASLPF